MEVMILGGAIVVLLALIAIRLINRPAADPAILRALDSLAQTQSALGGRLSQLTESQANAQSLLTTAVENRLTDMAQRQSTTLHDLRERLAVIDAAQKNITELSAQVVSLQDILANKQARGAFGEIQLNDLVSGMLPPNAYRFQAPLGDGRRVDCLLDLPNPPGSMAIDAKFPLESYHQLRNAADDGQKLAAARAFAAAIQKHIKDIADRYIVPGVTADCALMFLPSEAIYAELHANFPDVVERSFRAKVWIVSPTTLMATLNTVRAVLKDARMREQAGLIQREVQILLDDVQRLDDRVSALDRHFSQAADDIRHIRISTDKVSKRAERIDAIQLGDSPAQDA